MQETVTNTNERETLFSVFLDILESRDKIAQADSELQHEKYQRRTQRIYDYQARQQREATELRRRLDYVSQHAHVLESVLRGAAGEGAPLAYALVRQAAALQRCIAQCVANAARIRRLLSAAHRPQMDAVLAKMEAELSTWTAFLQRAADSSWNSEALYDNLLNMIAEQQRCVCEVSASPVVVSMCGAGAGEGEREGEREGEARDTDESAGEVTLRTPAPGRAPPSSTPIARD